jgi:membrane-associated phospholipid phosphatase
MRLWILAIIFLLAFVMLGLLVTSNPLNRMDVVAGGVRGSSPGLAALFTLSGRSVPLLALGILTVLAFALFHRPIWVPIMIFVSQLASQAVVEGAKHIFRRTRPDDWLVHHELGYSYPSGHATTAIVFFGAWLLITLFLPLARPLKLAIAVLIAVWMVGIDWSRIALSAHYLSDVVGGTLLGCAWMCALVALMIRLRVPLAW